MSLISANTQNLPHKCIDGVTVVRTVKRRTNQQPWTTKEVCSLLTTPDAALKPGDTAKKKSDQNPHRLCRGFRTSQRTSPSSGRHYRHSPPHTVSPGGEEHRCPNPIYWLQLSLEYARCTTTGGKAEEATGGRPVKQLGPSQGAQAPLKAAF